MAWSPPCASSLSAQFGAVPTLGSVGQNKVSQREGAGARNGLELCWAPCAGLQSVAWWVILPLLGQEADLDGLGGPVASAGLLGTEGNSGLSR
jgi:hypothetical protein